MNGFRVLVVDDEPLAREMVAALVRQDDEVSAVAECGDPAQVADAVARLAPHIVFLDVEMPETDGMQIAASLAAEDPVIVFITAFSQYAARAFDLRATDYVLKPFSDARFRDALARAKQRVREKARAAADTLAEAPPAAETGTPATLSFKDGDRPVVLDAAEILWIEAQDYYVRIHATQGRYMMRATLASLEERLDRRRFLRVHRAALVNLDAVREVHDRNGLRLTLTDGSVIPVSRARRRSIERALHPPVPRTIVS